MNDERLTPLLEQYAATRDIALRDALVEGYLPLAYAVARRFEGRGAESDDLRQIAAMALTKAVERFEPERGYRFTTYAVPTIAGDVRNFLRDKGSAMRMPRDTRQKLYQLRLAQDRFQREELREPSARELAEEMKITPDELLTLLDLRTRSETTSLDAPTGAEADTSLGELLGGEESGFERAEQADWMAWVMSKVNATERELLLLRYRDRLGQRETAKRLGVSQMQVSRLERRVLTRLKAIESQAQ